MVGWGAARPAGDWANIRTMGTDPLSGDASDWDHSQRDFICPECGATSSAGRRRVSRTWPPDPGSPWSGVLHDVTCAECGHVIPAHIGYRWGLTLEAARKEWVDLYRGTGPYPAQVCRRGPL